MMVTSILHGIQSKVCRCQNKAWVCAGLTLLLAGCEPFSLTTAQKASSADHTALSTVMWQQSYQGASAFAQASQRLAYTVTVYCQRDADNETLSPFLPMQQAWRDTMTAWMTLQGRDKGDEAAIALSWHIQFWPDKKNTTGRQLTQWLKKEQSEGVEDVAQASVAVQGLGALEWFLYDQPKALQTPNGCQLATAISQHLAQTGQSLQAVWQVNPWKNLSEKRVLGIYVGALNNQLDRTVKKLTMPLGKPGYPKPYQTEAWRSGTSMRHLKASVMALQQWYLGKTLRADSIGFSDVNVGTAVGLDALLRQQGEGQTADRIALRFEALLADWPAEPSMAVMLKTRAGYRELLNLYNGLEYIQLALHDDVAPSLGIVMGFNATDGD
ncbi:imelysin family protein [Photobacterium japonica]|uniref:imelysin family protein n=1 Tax=Photobacterium japonica TaxID=2910235 RepID=UPI003D10C6FD